MAKVYKIVCDITGAPAEGDQAVLHYRSGDDERTVQLDLSKVARDGLLRKLDMYFNAGSEPPLELTPAELAAIRKENDAIRTWALANGYRLNPNKKGRIAKYIREAYAEAQKAQETTLTLLIEREAAEGTLDPEVEEQRALLPGAEAQRALNPLPYTVEQATRPMQPQHPIPGGAAERDPFYMTGNHPY